VGISGSSREEGYCAERRSPKITRPAFASIAWAQLKRQGRIRLFAFDRFQQPDLLRVEVNLHDSTSKEVCANKSIHGPFTRTTQLVQIHRTLTFRLSFYEQFAQILPSPYCF
jgi:hypothetical protein